MKKDLINKYLDDNANYSSNIDEVKNKIDFTKYEKPKRKRFSFKVAIISLASISGFVAISILGTYLGLTAYDNYQKEQQVKYTIVQRKEMSKAIYNYLIMDDEGYIPVDVDIELLKYHPRQSDLYFKAIRIVSAFQYQMVMPIDFAPFFSEDLTGKIVDVFIVNLDFYHYVYDENIYISGAMIIFKYDNEINGFMTSYLGTYTHSYYTDTYSFQTCTFLTYNSVVNYYEKDDKIYIIDVNISDIENPITRVEYLENAYCPTPTSTYENIPIVENSYKRITINEAFDVLNDSYHSQKVKTTGIVTSFDMDIGLFWIESIQTPSLEMLDCSSGCEIWKDGKRICPIGVIDIGTELEFYYYQRYEGYKPKNLKVNYINVLS